MSEVVKQCRACGLDITQTLGIQALDSPPRYVDQLGASPDCIPDVYTFPMHMELKSLEHLSIPELRHAQRADTVIGPAIQAIEQQTWPEDPTNDPELSQLKQDSDKLILKEGLLHQVKSSHSLSYQKSFMKLC